MSEDRRLLGFPETLPAPVSFGGKAYTRDDSHVALVETATGPARILPIERAEGEAGIVAVYKSPTGELVAPTGVLFVRFKEGAQAADRRDALQAIGVEIVRVPSFAPHTAYVRSGDVAETLRRIGEISRMPDVEAIEVQMSREAQRK
ncbi:MAG: hypothetical protein ACHQ1G_04935 [Planctomycetota bacterium]